jgi:hypothetical protein
MNAGHCIAKCADGFRFLRDRETSGLRRTRRDV